MTLLSKPLGTASWRFAPGHLCFRLRDGPGVRCQGATEFAKRGRWAGPSRSFCGGPGIQVRNRPLSGGNTVRLRSAHDTPLPRSPARTSIPPVHTLAWSADRPGGCGRRGLAGKHPGGAAHCRHANGPGHAGNAGDAGDEYPVRNSAQAVMGQPAGPDSAAHSRRPASRQIRRSRIMAGLAALFLKGIGGTFARLGLAAPIPKLAPPPVRGTLWSADGRVLAGGPLGLRRNPQGEVAAPVVGFRGNFSRSRRRGTGARRTLKTG